VQSKFLLLHLGVRACVVSIWSSLSSLPCPIEDRQVQVFLLFNFVEFSCSWNQQLFFCFALVDVFLVPLSKERLLFPFSFLPFFDEFLFQ
jgi:hypothetical protein